ncbi:hypothetical protein [Sandaracinus amylolyticus]|uniref:hypothetical protein n=1 Tax=Sandaracinus amylolyticus TaxID=927083 RepID=UPI001F4430F8|nr:hypothetical protein [Sandaracinus amylolyticus]UJR79641.1 Hypothetical protein I5071_16790 [Sandaracinus amylolyticus]
MESASMAAASPRQRTGWSTVAGTTMLLAVPLTGLSSFAGMMNAGDSVDGGWWVVVGVSSALATLWLLGAAIVMLRRSALATSLRAPGGLAIASGSIALVGGLQRALSSSWPSERAEGELLAMIAIVALLAGWGHWAEARGRGGARGGYVLASLVVIATIARVVSLLA